MKANSKDNQEVMKTQMISLLLSFIFFNAIVKETDWLITSSVLILIVLMIIVRIWAKKRGESGGLANTNFTRRMP